jgi:alkylation response protein AidB-like acyl-CoA dehydrogenase
LELLDLRRITAPALHHNPKRVMARTSDAGAKGISAFVAEKGMPGLSFGANEKKMGWNAADPPSYLRGRARAEGQQGFKIAMAGLDGGRLNIGACSLGGAQAASQAFGKKLADFQAMQFMLADMATELEAARSLLWRAAAALDRKDRDATKLCAMAKRFSDTGFKVANEALQLHGGYGYLAEYGVEKIVRDLCSSDLGRDERGHARDYCVQTDRRSAMTLFNVRGQSAQ